MNHEEDEVGHQEKSRYSELKYQKLVKPEEAAKKEEGAINPVLKALQEAPAAPPSITSSITNQNH